MIVCRTHYREIQQQHSRQVDAATEDRASCNALAEAQQQLADWQAKYNTLAALLRPHPDDSIDQEPNTKPSAATPASCDQSMMEVVATKAEVAEHEAAGGGVSVSARPEGMAELWVRCQTLQEEAVSLRLANAAQVPAAASQVYMRWVHDF